MYDDITRLKKKQKSDGKLIKLLETGMDTNDFFYQ